MNRTHKILIGFFVVTCSASFAQVVLERSDDFFPQRDWIETLPYRSGEIFPIRFKVTACPLIEVKIDGQSFWLTFDFGSAGGMMVTTAIENKIAYAFVRELSATYADGRPRGKGKEIVLNRVEVLGKTYDRVTCDLYDWKIHSSYPNDGGISLEFIENARFTLDYRNKRLAVSERPFPDGLLKDGGFVVIPLLQSPGWNRYGLYLAGNVNGQDVIIYIDSGSSHSFVDRSLVDEKLISKAGNNDVCLSEIPVSLDGLDLKISKVRVSEIRRNTNYDRPVRMTIGSDLLKSLVVTVDRTEGRNLLIVHK